jgi:hypothetical protein
MTGMTGLRIRRLLRRVGQFMSQITPGGRRRARAALPPGGAYLPPTPYQLPPQTLQLPTPGPAAPPTPPTAPLPPHRPPNTKRLLREDADLGVDVPLAAITRLLDGAATLGKGGQGTVRPLRGAPELVYKEYNQAGFGSHHPDAAALKALVSLRTSMTASERAEWDRRTAWPLCRVMDGPRPAGFLMHLVPKEFRVPEAGGRRSGGAGSTPMLTVDYLNQAPKPLWASVPQPDPGARRRIALAFAELLDELHRRGMVFGDISQSNVLWTLAGGPSVYLIDCDGVRVAGSRPVLPQADTPGWDDPNSPPGTATPDTDRYKLALLVGRMVSRQQELRPAEGGAPVPLTPLPGVVPPESENRLARLWQDAAVPGHRPIAREWAFALSGRTRRSVAPVTARPRPQADPRKTGAAPRRSVPLQPPGGGP